MAAKSLTTPTRPRKPARGPAAGIVAPAAAARNPGIAPSITLCMLTALRVASQTPQPDAMALATSTRDGAPSARIVLYRGIAEGQVCFFTNYRSRKAREVEMNPRAALLFYWEALGRQVRLEGAVARLGSEPSDHYWRSRPRDSQLASFASPQSEPLDDRSSLEQEVDRVRHRFEGRDVPRPEHWGGFGVRPDRVEFWVHQEHRLHDRFLYDRAGGGWRISRLAP